MPLAPYGRKVIAPPAAYKRMDMRIFVFAGEEAWAAAGAFLRSGEPRHARERYTLVCPQLVKNDAEQSVKPFKPLASTWPVAGLKVVIWNCRASEQLVRELAAALQRDGARAAEMRPMPLEMNAQLSQGETPAHWVEQQLCWRQTFFYADVFDAVAAEAQRKHEFDRLVGHIAWNLDHLQPEGCLHRLCAAGVLGDAGQLALAQVPRAQAALAQA